MAALGPLPDVANVCKVRILGTMNSANWANVLHVKYGSITPDTSTLATVATAIRSAWTTNLAPRLATTVLLTTVEVTDLASRAGAQGVDSGGSAGTRAGTPAPNSIAICGTLKIARRYRGGHPRIYLPGAVQSDILTGRTWDPTYRLATENALINFRAAINALTTGSTTWQLCSVSYYRSVGGVVSYKSPPEVDVITGCVLHTRIDSMRRRTGKEVT